MFYVWAWQLAAETRMRFSEMNDLTFLVVVKASSGARRAWRYDN